MNTFPKYQRRHWYFLLLSISLIVLSLTAYQTIYAKTQSPQLLLAQSATIRSIQNLSFPEMMALLDWMSGPFILLALAGLAALLQRGWSELLDRTRSRRLLKHRLELNTLNQFRGMVREGRPSRASKLFRLMITSFNKTNQAESLSRDIHSFLWNDRIACASFNRLMAYFIDIAGAFGLLGTAWAIFSTVYGGAFDGAAVLRGTSSALLATIAGVLLGFVFNLGTKALSTTHNSHLKMISRKAEELRQTLLTLQLRATTGRQTGAGRFTSTHMGNMTSAGISSY